MQRQAPYRQVGGAGPPGLNTAAATFVPGAMNLQNANAKVDTLGSEMRAFMQAMSGQRTGAPSSGGWVQQMMMGTANGMPLQMHAPNVNMVDSPESDFGRMARGSAGVAELVAVVNQQP